MKANKELILKDRDAGMKYREIAEKHGVSCARVGQICAEFNRKSYRFVTATGCVYPNLRLWMNERKISRCEMVVLMGFAPANENIVKLRDIMRGHIQPSKKWIDGMLKATGMPYEKLFATEG